MKTLFCLFDLILYVPPTIFQLCRDGSSWIEPVLSKDYCVLLKDTTLWRRWGLNPQPHGLESIALQLSHCAPYEDFLNRIAKNVSVTFLHLYNRLVLTTWMLGNFSWFCYRLPVCWLITFTLQTVWTKIRSDKMSGLIWIQTIWHSYGFPEIIFGRKKKSRRQNACKFTQ